MDEHIKQALDRILENLQKAKEAVKQKNDILTTWHLGLAEDDVKKLKQILASQ